MTPIEMQMRALGKLKVLAAGEDAEPDDIALIAEKYAGLHAMLLTKDLVTWSLTEDIPAKAQEPVILMLAAFAAVDFGIQEPELGQMISMGGFNLAQPSLAERQLRSVMAEKYVSHPVRTTYY